MPRSKKDKKKGNCDLCCDSLEQGHDVLICEGGCGSNVHRYCAGVTIKHFAELTSSSAGSFVCFFCSQKLFKAIVDQLQIQVSALNNEVSSLKGELSEAKTKLEQTVTAVEGVRAATSSTSRTAQATTANATIRRKGASHHGHKQPDMQKRTGKLNGKGSYAATVMNKGPVGESPYNTQKIVVNGARRVWGTLRSATQTSVKNTITHLCKIDVNELHVKRKFKSPQNGKARWWFVLHGSEEYLKSLESSWDCVRMQTGWRIEPCYKPAAENQTSDNNAPPPANVDNSVKATMNTSMNDPTPTESNVSIASNAVNATGVEATEGDISQLNTSTNDPTPTELEASIVSNAVNATSERPPFLGQAHQ